MSSLATTLIAFAIIMGGAFAGAGLRRVLPEHHLDDSAKDIFRLGAGLLATISALVLGLLINSARDAYDLQANQVRQMTANIILLDHVLAQYGAEAQPLRQDMRLAIGPMVERIWGDAHSRAAKPERFQAMAATEQAIFRLNELQPKDAAQASLKHRALEISVSLAQLRLAVFEQANDTLPLPFLAVLVFWLTIIFASFTLFARLNATTVTALAVFALSAAGAIFLILEMDRPFDGLMQISSAPLRNALAPLP